MLKQYISTMIDKIKEKGYTDAEICDSVGGLSRMTLYRWRTGKLRDIGKFYQLCEDLSPLMNEDKDVLFTNGLAAIRNYYINK